ncbi:response regulator [Methylorubrum extorquens]|jgi:CheY-like chemotaxis protein
MSGSRISAPPLVLVVEDEGLVRMMAVDMLEDAGCTVIEAASADEAWALLESRDDISVLFTDIEMPGSMNGFALAARVAKRWPHVRLVITSGRCRPAPRDVPDHGMFVPKPYRAEEVLSAFERAQPL